MKTGRLWGKRSARPPSPRRKQQRQSNQRSFQQTGSPESFRGFPFLLSLQISRDPLLERLLLKRKVAFGGMGIADVILFDHQQLIAIERRIREQLLEYRRLHARDRQRQMQLRLA